MKFGRSLSRLALLSLAAAALVGLTKFYGDSKRPPLPHPKEQAERQHRPSAPQVGEFPEFLAGLVEVALYALMGRIVFRLRLSPALRNEGQPILLGLHRR